MIGLISNVVKDDSCACNVQTGFVNGNDVGMFLASWKCKMPFSVEM